MSVAAEVAVQAWINARSSLSSLKNGAFLAGYGVRSPADGPYALLSRTTAGTLGSLVAEASNPSIARVQAYVYAGTVEAAEQAAADLASAFHELRGCPEPCGATGVTVLATDNVVEPAYVPQPADAGEQYCFQTAADFVLLK
jgi:hypothetical protein